MTSKIQRPQYSKIKSYIPVLSMDENVPSCPPLLAWGDPAAASSDRVRFKF